MSNALRSLQQRLETASTKPFAQGFLEELAITASNADPAAVQSTNGTTDDGREPYLTSVPKDLTGLALSGGGIRSATFNLGVLQGLAERNLLGLFDYVSTVSGGGYIGAFWSAWRARNPNAGIFPSEQPPAGAAAMPETRFIRHLREFSRFLAPRWGVFETDTWQFFGAAASAILPALVIGFCVLSLFIWTAFSVTANTMGGAETVSLAGWTIAWFSRHHLAMAVVGLATVLLLLVFEHESRRVDSVKGEKFYGVLYVVLVLVSTAIAGFTAWRLLSPFEVWEYFEVMPGFDAVEDHRIRFFSPALGWSAAMIVLIGARGIASRFVAAPGDGLFRTAFDRVIARLLGMALVWTAIVLFLFAAAAVWSRQPLLITIWSAVIGTGSGTLFTLLQKALSRQPSRASGGTRRFLERYALPLLAAIAITAAAVGVACFVLWMIEIGAATAALITAAGVVVGSSVLFNPNEVGMHSFYRSRLSRAYLGASNPKTGTAAANRQSTERPDDDIRMDELPAERPLHLLCCAANDLGGDHLATLRRGARSAVLSPLGFHLANRFQRWEDAPAKVSVATAMTASGAAFNSNMGSISMDLGPSATFLMAMLNLRLGYWYHLTQARRFFQGTALFREMFSQTRSGRESNAIHLSDGGHFENLAVYELLRRKAKYILVSDCGADADATFDDLGNALRRAREDFGVEVDIDVSVLKPDERGLSRQHVAAGDVIYPGGERGILILLKPRLAGDEPADVLQYGAHNAKFPNESTGDQFYDEKQWESYRRLGLHTARVAFRFLDERDAPTQLRPYDVFGDARTEWLPTPATLPSQLMARAAELQNIERQVVRLGHLPLLRDLYPELQWDKSVRHVNDTPASDIARLVPLFTQVMQLMTNVYVSCELERYWSHPLNIGWVNYFGRWSTMPVFRELWPFLSPMFNPKMRSFFEDRLELRSAGSLLSTAEIAEPAQNSLAFEIWKAMHPDIDRSDHKTMVYRVQIGKSWTIEAAILYFKERDDGVKTWRETWRDPDFFVPPSLWQAGIGRGFLDAIGPGIVRILNDPARRKEVSEIIQMYTQAGFSMDTPEPEYIVMERGVKTPLPPP